MIKTIHREELLALLVAFACFFLLPGCGSQANGEEKDDEEQVILPVEIGEVALGSVSASYSGTTSLEADEEALVVTKTTGIILEILVEEGDYVNKGAVLARLEQEFPQLELNQSKANFMRVENDFKRKKDLYKRNLVSSEAYELSRFEYESQRASYELSKLQLSYTTIIAPISGYISERKVKVGTLVQTHAGLFKIDNFDPLLAIMHIPEREVDHIEVGQTVTILIDALADSIYSGSISRISPVINRDTGTFKVTASIYDTSKKLKPGMFGRVSIVYETRDQVTVLPREALISEDGNYSVFTVTDNVASRQEISTGLVNGRYIEITDGLEAGQQVVVTGQGTLSNGSHIEIINEP